MANIESDIQSNTQSDNIMVDDNNLVEVVIHNFNEEDDNKLNDVEDTDDKTNDVSNLKMPNIKLIKRTKLVCDSLNEFLNGFFQNDEEKQRWTDFEQQTKFRQFIRDNKLKMRNPNWEEEKKQKKEEKLQKRKDKAKEIQEKRVAKAQSRPKSAYYFYKKEEEVKIKEENPEFTKKDIHKKLQEGWQVIKKDKNSEIYKKYDEIAIEAEKNMPPKPTYVEVQKKKQKKIKEKLEAGEKVYQLPSQLKKEKKRLEQLANAEKNKLFPKDKSKYNKELRNAKKEMNKGRFNKEQNIEKVMKELSTIVFKPSNQPRFVDYRKKQE